MVKWIIEAHKGDIYVESEIGKGSSFIFKLKKEVKWKKFLKKLLILFFITMTGVLQMKIQLKKTKTVRVLNVDVKISIEQAKQLALNHSKVAKNSAKWLKFVWIKKIENLFMK